MGLFTDFLIELCREMGIQPPEMEEIPSEILIARSVVSRINEFFFQSYNDIGNTQFNGENLQYFSDFHRFWEANHKQILDPRIDIPQAKLVAQSLNTAVLTYGNSILQVQHDTCGLPPEAIAQVRFFTANQDFRKPPEEQYSKYAKNAQHFESQEIANDPEAFLNYLGVTGLSQSDKRRDFAYNAANFLLNRGITAVKIADIYNNDAVQVREALVETANLGYGAKKANMFIRDMVELGVWSGLKRFDQIDVPSDINTMKLALRTRVLQTETTLVSSFLDIFCHQISCIDEMSARAWRGVWEEWCKLDSNTAPSSPSQMDFLLYRIGREYCDENVVQYNCELGHSFYNFGARLKNCRMCKEAGKRNKSTADKRCLPCQISSSELPRNGKGELLLKDGNLLKTFNGICIFESVCRPKTAEFRSLNPPKSISIKGQTGWTESYAYKEKGGGGMMG